MSATLQDRGGERVGDESLSQTLCLFDVIRSLMFSEREVKLIYLMGDKSISVKEMSLLILDFRTEILSSIDVCLKDKNKRSSSLWKVLQNVFLLSYKSLSVRM